LALSFRLTAVRKKVLLFKEEKIPRELVNLG